MGNGIITRNRTVQNEAVARLLAAAKPGEIVTYEAMGRAVDPPCTDIRDGYDHIKYAAWDICLERDGIEFECITDVGLRRMLPGEVATQTLAKRRKRIRSVARKGAKILVLAARPGDLTDAEKAVAQTGAAYFGAVMAVSSLRAVRTLEAEVQRREMTPDQTLAHLALFTKVK